MFLNELNKKQSIAFINLVQMLSKIDTVFADNEKDLIDEYIEELSLTNETIEDLTFESAVKELVDSTQIVKHIVYFELVGLALVDGSYEEKEEVFLDNLAVHFNINKEKQHDFLNYFKMVKDIYDITVVDYESKIESLKKSAMELL